MNVRKLPAITGAVLIAVAATAHANIASDLQAQVQSLQRQLDAVKAQLDAITESRLDIRDGRAYASTAAGLGIDWDWDAIARLQTGAPIVIS